MIRRATLFGVLVALGLSSGCGPTPPPQTAMTAADYAGPIESDDTQTGQQVYQRICVGCHGPEGTAPDLPDLGATPGQVRMQVRQGSGRMPAIGTDKVTDAELEAMLAYLETLGAVKTAEPAPAEPAPAEPAPAEPATP